MEESGPNRLKTLLEKEQFLFFPQCFQKACFLGASKGVIVWEWVNMKNQFTERQKTMWEKVKMLVTGIFSFSYKLRFQKDLSLGSLKVWIVWYRVNPFPNNKF